MKNLFVVLIAVTLIFSSCVTFFTPRKQKVQFNTGSADAEVYLDKDLVGEGTLFTYKVNKKEGDSRQLTIKRKGYKDQYVAFIKCRRPIAWWPLSVLNVSTALYGLAVDMANPKNIAF